MTPNKAQEKKIRGGVFDRVEKLCECGHLANWHKERSGLFVLGCFKNIASSDDNTEAYKAYETCRCRHFRALQ